MKRGKKLKKWDKKKSNDKIRMSRSTILVCRRSEVRSTEEQCRCTLVGEGVGFRSPSNNFIHWVCFFFSLNLMLFSHSEDR